MVLKEKADIKNQWILQRSIRCIARIIAGAGLAQEKSNLVSRRQAQDIHLPCFGKLI
jgi:hypothetical protein